MRLTRKAFWLCLVWSSILCILIYPVLRFIIYYFSPGLTFLAAITVFLLFLVIFIKVLILYFCFSIYPEGKLLTVSSGFFIRSEKRLLLSAATGAKLISTPLMRHLSLTFVLITFEGSVYILPPVSADFAALILDNINERPQREEI